MGDQDYRIWSGARIRGRSSPGVALAWPRYVGYGGRVIGLDRFGASAPYKVMFERFGFTVENMVERARALAGRSLRT
jgi:transketolase